MTNGKFHRIGLVRANPDYWRCFCGEGEDVKPRLLKVCGDCGAEESKRPNATWEEIKTLKAKGILCSTHK